MKDSPVRQNIVETATKLFYQNGYNLTGINEIIKEAGIAKATLYHHFKSKEDICLAYLVYKNNTFTTDIRAFVEKAPAGDAQILALFDFLQSFFQGKDFNGCWCLNTIAELPKGSERIKEEIQKQKHQLIQFITSLAKSFLSTDDKTVYEALARRIYLLYESALAESHLHQAPWPIDDARELCKILLNNQRKS